MASNLWMTMLCGCEFLLTVGLCLAFWKKGLHKHFQAMASYLTLRAVAAPVLFLLLTAYLQAGIKICYGIYFFAYWAVYITSAALLYFVCFEVFRFILSPFAGLAKLGTVIFRWAAMVSLILTFATVSFTHPAILTIADVASRLMRSASILELCLLAFMCLCMNALKLSIRDMSFGITLGLGLLSADDFLQGSMLSRLPSLVMTLQFTFESVTLLVLAVWVVYALLPQGERKPVLIAASSPIYRWNEIASALGHTGTRVAVQQPASSFFLTNVEQVVDRVVTKNLKESESKP